MAVKTTLAEASLPAAERPVHMMARRDLQVDQVDFQQARYWHVKDPLSLRYYQLRDEEYSILRLLDGRQSLASIKRHLDSRFAPRRIKLSHLQAFLGMLHREGLTIADVDGQGEQLLERNRSRRRGLWFAAVANPLAIRFRGINPSRFFDWVFPLLSWMFRPWLVVVGFSLVVAALTLLMSHFDTLHDRLPDLATFFSGRNVIWMAVALIAVKLLHELAHGLTCRKFGGDCHELGIMLLAFVPCLYCNVSDSWTLPNKWHRIAISGAGICVELVLASICTFLWWFSAPGFVNSLCLNTVVICSVGTLLLNGNPLLRYDGYYILADLVEVPNLQTQAAAEIRRLLRRFYLKAEFTDDRLNASRHPYWLLTYGLASQVYRWCVVAGILWICFTFFRGQGLATVGKGLVMIVVAGLLGNTVSRCSTFLFDPRGRYQMDYRRLLLTGSLTLFVASICLFWPLPFRVSAPLILAPTDARRVYVTAPGRLDCLHVKAGTFVSAGQPLAQLGNNELTQEILELTGQRDLQLQHVANLRKQQLSDAAAREDLPAALELLQSLEKQLGKRVEFQERLTLCAPCDGTVLPPRSQDQKLEPGELPTWSGVLLDPENVGCHVDEGTLFCLLGDASHLEATLLVDQTDLEFVAVGQTVSIQLAALPGPILAGKIREISGVDARQVPPELAASGELPVVSSNSGGAQPYRPAFAARVTLDSAGQPLLIGMTGQAKIVVEPQPLGQRFYRLLRQTFGFTSPEIERRR